MPARSFRFNKQEATSDNLATSNKNDLSRSMKAMVSSRESTPRPSRTRKPVEHYNPLEENKKPQHSGRTNVAISNNDHHNMDGSAVLPRSTTAIVTPAKKSSPAKPSRIRKQVEHYNPLEENKKPQVCTSRPCVAPPSNRHMDANTALPHIVTPAKASPKPSRIRKPVEHYSPLEENKKPQHGHHASINDNATNVTVDRNTTAIATPNSKPSSTGRIRKPVEHYNPLEENKKPQHKQTTSKKTNPVKTVATPEETTLEPLNLKPLSKELLCDHCNFGGDLMQCHAWIGGTKYSCSGTEIGCTKLVHPFCVGRQDIPKRSWICNACSNEYGFKVTMPKELRNKGIDDYGHEFSDTEPTDGEIQQLEKELFEWGRKSKIVLARDFERLPQNLLRSLGRYEESEDDNYSDTSSDVYSVGPCDVCKAEGELLRCQAQLAGIGCGKGVHMYCVFRDEMPEGDWVCEDCARENNLKLDNKYPAKGYEYPISDTGSATGCEDTFEWNEDLGYRIQIGSRVGVYDEEDDEYRNGTVNFKDVMNDMLFISFDDGTSSTICVRERPIRLLSEESHPSLHDLRLRMRLSLDPSLPNYIICGRGVTKAHDRKHAHRLLEHHVEVLLDDSTTASLELSDDSCASIICEKVLEKLNDDGIEFIQWDASIGGFGKASKKETRKKIMSMFEEKREERAYTAPGYAEPPTTIDNDGPILHALLINGGYPPVHIPPKQVSDDPFLADARLQERHRRYHARESRLVSIQRSKIKENGSNLTQQRQTEPAHSNVWNSDIFDDAPEVDQGQNARRTLNISHTQPLIQQMQEDQNKRDTTPEFPENKRRKIIPRPLVESIPMDKKRGDLWHESMPEVLANSGGKIEELATPTKKRGLPPKKDPPSKKLKESAKAASNTNSANREIALCESNCNKWGLQLKKLALFRKKYGHCNVPSSYPPNQALATWAKRQRHQYQLYLKKNPRCTLTPERIKALSALDFCFDTQQIKWLQKYEELKAFAAEHGHCRPSATKNSPSSQLGAWVKHQRAQRKLFDDGRSTFITPSRIKMLDSIGFVWTIRN